MDRIGIFGFALLLIGITTVHCYPQFDNLKQLGTQRQNPWLRPQQPDRGGSSTTTSRPTTQSPQYFACFQSCPATSEYNPICGSDNVNYYNENRFNCALTCGLRIQQVHTGIC
ncbi:uncharacterized protein LOC128259536 [Drosophila gunungcola]|nr:uncharacterized protein LOC128259536 [Drosophila gunungcola]